jgi:hypothetical protein
MATNRDLLKEAIADAKAVKETAIANAKAALEEAFTPYLKEKLSAKLNEMDEEMYEEAEEMDEMMVDDDMMDEEISLDELLAELDEYAEDQPNRDMDGDGDVDADDVKMMKEAEEEEMAIEDMDENDLKSFIEDVIKDMVSAGELEAGHEGMENEEGAEGEEEMDMEADEDEINIDELLAEMEVDEYKKFKKVSDPSPKSKNAIHHKGKDEYVTDETEEDDAPYSKGEATKISFEEDMNESLFDVLTQFAQDFKGSDDIIDKMSGALAGTGIALSTVLLALKDKTFRTELIAAAKEDVGKLKDTIVSKFKGNKSSPPAKSEMEEQLNELRSELNEVNLLNAKLLYTNKIFRNKSLTESQKVKVLTAFDKATSKKEVELVYETLTESLRVSTTKAPIKESMGFASKALGGVTSKPIIENDAFSRMRELAFGNKK